MELIRDFKKIDKNDVALAGGKGASLGEMTQADIPVPSGFVILASAFEKFLEETDLNVEIEAILDSVNHKEIHTVDSASEKIKALILQAEIPQDIATEIQKFFKNLGSKYVAVRSSATAEDSASAAWAGQLESYLNTTEKDLSENVKKCWASLFTPRAIFYRFEKNLHKQKISVAVVVQKMIDSEKSGIAFSVHPVTQDRNQMIIEAGFGLGEAIVSGQITPDSYVVEKEPRRIIDKNIQTQSRGLYRVKNGGNEWRDVSIAQGQKQVLSDNKILELSEIILQIENHYGFPCDIEWAFDNNRFYIVQSRPITTLTQYQVESPKSGEDSLVKYAERKMPFYNLVVSIWLHFVTLKQTIGKGFTRSVFTHSSGICDLYASNKEISDIVERILSSISERKIQFEVWYRKAKKLNKRADKLISDYQHNEMAVDGKLYNRVFGLFSNNFGYATILPFWVLYAINTEIEKGRSKESFGDVLEMYEELKSETRYPQLVQDVISKYFNRAAEILNISPELATCIHPEELGRIVDGEKIVSVPELEKRVKWVALIRGKFPYEVDTIFDKSKFAHLIQEIDKNITEIRGNIAFKGKVRGMAKIVSAIGDMKKFEKGNILVSIQSSPALMPVLVKCSAIVTDEGGIMCHAAIISRELKVPCIIGTRIATKVIKDGDVVEVDANNGVVKILK